MHMVATLLSTAKALLMARVLLSPVAVSRDLRSQPQPLFQPIFKPKWICTCSWSMTSAKPAAATIVCVEKAGGQRHQKRLAPGGVCRKLRAPIGFWGRGEKNLSTFLDQEISKLLVLSKCLIPVRYPRNLGDANAQILPLFSQSRPLRPQSARIEETFLLSA